MFYYGVTMESTTTASHVRNSLPLSAIDKQARDIAARSGVGENWWTQIRIADQNADRSEREFGIRVNEDGRMDEAETDFERQYARESANLVRLLQEWKREPRNPQARAAVIRSLEKLSIIASASRDTA